MAAFRNAPVTKFCVVATTGASLFAGLTKSTAQLSLNLQSVTQDLELWRLLTCNFVFSHPGEIIFGVYLLYYFRLFERQAGSSKYAAFVGLAYLLSTLAQMVLLAALQDHRSFAPGPYGLIFAMFVPFFFDVPSSARFSVLRMNFTDKAFVYLAGLQVLLSASPYTASLLPGTCGALAGLAYRANVLGIRAFRFPKAAEAFAARTVGSFLSGGGGAGGHPPVVGAGAARGSPVPPRPEARGDPWGGAAAAAMRGAGGAGAGAGNAPSLSGIGGPMGMMAGMGGAVGGAMGSLAGRDGAMGGGIQAPPREEDVGMLTSMGFPRDAALRALALAGGDVHVATNILLSGGE